MGLNDTPSAQRVHISFFGRRNAGKSSLVNAVTGQSMSIVSEVKGTTTDPVKKSMEILPIGPVLIIDTPGYDDEGILGDKRVEKTEEILKSTDIAVLVIDPQAGVGATEKELVQLFETRTLPYIIVLTKSDLDNDFTTDSNRPVISVSSLTGEGIHELKELLGRVATENIQEKSILGDLVSAGDTVLLVIPIDESAPKGRIILPQQLVLRELLDKDAVAIAVKENAVRSTIDNLKKKPVLVITDSQAFEQVATAVPEDIALTSFSILMARYKGYLATALKGVSALNDLPDGARILIAEGCTHHRQCGDIGTVKIPAWLKRFTGKNVVIETSSGNSFPKDLTPYDCVIHCGGCMLNEREVLSRMQLANEQGVPFINYGIAIAKMKGILERSVAVLPEGK